MKYTWILLLLLSNFELAAATPPNLGPSMATGSCNGLLDLKGMETFMSTLISTGDTNEKIIKKYKEPIVVPYLEVTQQMIVSISKTVTANCYSGFIKGCIQRFPKFPINPTEALIPADLVCKNFSKDNNVWSPDWVLHPVPFSQTEWDLRRQRSLNMISTVTAKMTFLKDLTIKYLDVLTITCVGAIFVAAIAAAGGTGGGSLVGGMAAIVAILLTSYGEFTIDEQMQFDSIREQYTANVEINIDESTQTITIDNIQMAVTKNGDHYQTTTTNLDSDKINALDFMIPSDSQACTKSHMEDGQLINDGDC